MQKTNKTKILSERPDLAANGEVNEILDDLDNVEVLARLADTPEGEALRKYHTNRIQGFVLDILDLAGKRETEKLLYVIAKLEAEMSIAKHISNARSQESSLQQALDELLKSK